MIWASLGRLRPRARYDRGPEHLPQVGPRMESILTLAGSATKPDGVRTFVRLGDARGATKTIGIRPQTRLTALARRARRARPRSEAVACGFGEAPAHWSPVRAPHAETAGNTEAHVRDDSR